MSSPSWKKYELFTKKIWMISLDTKFERIAPEITMIKQLAKCDSKMYLKFNQKTQNDIQSEIKETLIERRSRFGAYPAPSLYDLSTVNICYDCFGITWEGQLKIWLGLNGKGMMRIENTIPTINDIQGQTFHVRIVPPLSTDIKIIDIADTERLLTKTCIPNGKSLGGGYCREHEEKFNINIPIAVIRIIIRYFNVDSKALKKYWTSNMWIRNFQCEL